MSFECCGGPVLSPSQDAKWIVAEQEQLQASELNIGVYRAPVNRGWRLPRGHNTSLRETFALICRQRYTTVGRVVWKYKITHGNLPASKPTGSCSIPNVADA